MTPSSPDRARKTPPERRTTIRELEDEPEEGEERPQQASRPGKLLDRLLYCGKLPRYAFPTDVATFHVFDRDRSSRFRPIMRFAPQQGLPVALTQYAPGKQVWISGKSYTSGAIYSVMADDRYTAWEEKRIYMECSQCGFAKTFSIAEANQKRNARLRSLRRRRNLRSRTVLDAPAWLCPPDRSRRGDLAGRHPGNELCDARQANDGHAR